MQAVNLFGRIDLTIETSDASLAARLKYFCYPFRRAEFFASDRLCVSWCVCACRTFHGPGTAAVAAFATASPARAVKSAGLAATGCSAPTDCSAATAIRPGDRS